MIANVYKNAKYFYWYPLKFNFQGYQVDSIKETYYFNNGTRFNGHAFLYQAMDYANNNQTSLILTDVLSSSDIFKIKENPKEKNELTEIISTISIKVIFVHWDITSEAFSHTLPIDDVIPASSKVIIIECLT